MVTVASCIVETGNSSAAVPADSFWITEKHMPVETVSTGEKQNQANQVNNWHIAMMATSRRMLLIPAKI